MVGEHWFFINSIPRTLKSVSKLIQLRWILWWYSHEPYLHESNVFLWPFGGRLVRIQRFHSSFQSLIIYFVHNFLNFCVGIGLFAGSVGSLRGTFFEWFPTVSLDIIMKVSWLQMHVIEPISTPTEWIHRLKRAKQIYSEQITKMVKKKYIIRENSRGMNKENAYQEARQKHCLRVSTVRKKVFLPFF